MVRKPQVIVGDLRVVAARGAYQRGMAVSLTVALALRERKHLHTWIAARIILGARDGLRRRAIANDEQLEIGNVLNEHALDRVRQQSGWADDRKQHGEKRRHGIAQSCSPARARNAEVRSTMSKPSAADERGGGP